MKNWQLTARAWLFAISLATTGYANAGPASPETVQLVQPDGSTFTAQAKGDEFQGWTETSDGYTVVKNPNTGFFELAAQGAGGQLVPSGIRVGPAGGSAQSSAAALPAKGLRPPRNTELANFQAAALNSTFSGRSASASASGPAPTGTWAPVPVSGAKKILVILVNFQDATLSSGAAPYWSDAVFNTSSASVAKFYQDNSFGTVSISPVANTQPGSSTGVVTVTVPQSHPNCSSNCSYATESAWVNSALAAAAPYVNFAGLDTNGDGSITVNEVLVYFILAGYEASGGGGAPNYWAHAWGGAGVSVAGKSVNHWALNGEMYSVGNRMKMGVIAHETGHAIGGLPDLYDVNQVNQGLGIFSLMAGGSWGGKAGEQIGATPVSMDALSRQFLGWSTPQFPGDGAFTTFDSALASPSSPIMLMNSTMSTSEYWLVENRAPVSWDAGMYKQLGASWSGGLLIQHVDLNIGSQGANNFNAYVSGSHQGVMAVEPATATCSMKATSGATRGCPSILYYSGGTSTFNSGSNPTSNYYSGTPSGVGLTSISTVGVSMNAIVSEGGTNNVPAAPTIGTATPGNASIIVAFTPGSLGAGSLVNRTADCGGITMTGTNSPITVFGLTNGVSYTCRVKTTSTIGDSPWSAMSNAVVPVAPAVPPSAPTIGTATAGVTSASVTFTPGAQGSGNLVNYTANCSGITGSGGSSPIVVNGLTAGVSYTCTVQTTTTAGTSAASAASNTVVPTPTPAGVNVALDVNGGVATASSTLAGHPVATVNNNERTGGNWSNGLSWTDSTIHVYPDWVQINFNGVKTIDHVVLYTMEDAYATAVEPTDTMTFSLYGITGFTVQTWDGANWVTQATITGNNLVKRTVNFAAVATDRIRVNVTASPDGYSYISEIEAFSAGPATPPSAPTIGTATAGDSSASVAFTPGALGTGTLVNYTASCSGITANGASSPILVTGLTNGVSYTCTVKTTSSVGASAFSAASNTVIPAAIPPSAPTIGVATAGDTNASVAFTPGALGSGTLVNYTASCGGITANGASSPILVTGLTNGVSYSCTVKTTSSVGASAFSAASNSVTPVAIPAGINVALDINGGVATASSTLAGHPVNTVNNGERTGGNWTNGMSWTDASPHVYPDWVQINFSGIRTIDHVVLYTMEDAYASAVEPTDTMTFSLYGITGFTVQTWDGANWVTQVTITGNNLVKRTVNFGAVATDRIRINVTASPDGYSYISEIEAFTAGAPTPPSAPTIGTATAGDSSASVAFTPGTLGSGTLVNYTADCGGNTATGANTPITVSGLTNGVSYTCKVKTTSSVGTSAFSAVSNTVVPAAAAPVSPSAPTIGVATAGDTNASVAFTAGALGSGTFVNYAATCGGITSIGFSSPILVTGLTNGTSYTCTVRTTSSVGVSAASAASNAVIPTAVVGGINVALDVNGGVATASSTMAGHPVSTVNNNERTGGNWSNGMSWTDGTSHTYPDWVQINFSGVKTIDRVVLYTMEDAYASAVEPTDTMTFSLYGITGFTVQTWDGANWVTQATITGNNLVKRTVNFSAVSTDRIRINVTASPDGYSYISEIEAFTAGAPVPPSAPTIGTATAGDTNASVAFTPGALGSGTLTNYTADCGGITATGNSSPILVTGLTNGLSYTCKVKTTSSVGTSAFSAVSNTVVPAVAAPVLPSAPTIGTATAGDTNASVAFTPGALGSGTLVNYTASCGGITANGASSPILVTGLTNGVSYTCTVKTTSSVGASAFSAASNAVIPTAQVGGINVALDINGGVATASSTMAGHPVSTVNNNERTGGNWTNGMSWTDNTSHTYPDWVQINFSGVKTIDRVVLYTMEDAYASAVEPTDTMTFSLYGITGFTVQTWDGANWVTQATITGNNLVKRTVSFAAVATDRIRINVTASPDGYSYISEIEALTAGPAVPPSAPTIGTATPGDTSASVAFTPGALGSGALTNYTADCGGITATGNNSPIQVTGLTNGVSYTCKVKTTSSVGTSAFSAVSNTVVPSAALVSVNVALATNGGVATASSTMAGHPVATVNNNERTGGNWSNGTSWADNTAHIYPDWVQINFSSVKTVNKVVLYTLQDAYASPLEPTDTMTFAQYGITGFTVQTWDGANWVTQATITGNNLVKRTVNFAAVATDRIRVNVTASPDGSSYITEIEAWTP